MNFNNPYEVSILNDTYKSLKQLSNITTALKLIIDQSVFNSDVMNVFLKQEYRHKRLVIAYRKLNNYLKDHKTSVNPMIDFIEVENTLEMTEKLNNLTDTLVTELINIDYRIENTKELIDEDIIYYHPSGQATWVLSGSSTSSSSCSYSLPQPSFPKSNRRRNPLPKPPKKIKPKYGMRMATPGISRSVPQKYPIVVIPPASSWATPSNGRYVIRNGQVYSVKPNPSFDIIEQILTLLHDVKPLKSHQYE